MKKIDNSANVFSKNTLVQQAKLAAKTEQDRVLARLFQDMPKLTSKSSFKIEHHHPTYPPAFEPKLYQSKALHKKGK
jgi:hypothetical protein